MRLLLIVILWLWCIEAQAADNKLQDEEGYQQYARKICAQKQGQLPLLVKQVSVICMKLQTKAYKKLMSLNVYANHEFYSLVSFPYCSSLSRLGRVVDLEKKVWCLEKEIAGYHEVKHHRQQFGDEKINTLVRRNLKKHGSWFMTGVLVRGHFR